MRHIDLFSGIGGFALAAREVWGDEYENFCFCEINKYAQAVLRKNFGKDITIYGDIRGLSITNANSNRLTERSKKVHATEPDEQALGDAQGRTRSSGVSPVQPNGVGCNTGGGVREGGQILSTQKRTTPQDKQERDRRVDRTGTGNCIDLLTGGFPCQPFSQAGQRKGTDDDRYLWPEMLRVIHEFKPTWVIAENVRGLLSISDGVVFEQVCVDLENEGYEVQTFVIPACAVNAPHRRDRVWIVAHNNSVQLQESGSELEAGRNRPDDQDAPTKHRVERLKALGNAIVPQVVKEIFMAIKTAEVLG